MSKNKLFNKKMNKNIIIVTLILVLAGALIISSIANFNEELNTNKIAKIDVNGMISLYDSSSFFSSGGTSTENFVNRIEKAESNPLVKAIILEINSGGGTVLASKEMAKAVEEADKPIVAWIRETGASGGYWVASAADKIIADQTSMTGSIGVRGSFLEFSELFEKYGIDYERVISGKYKDLGSPYKNMTEEEYRIWKNKIDIINNIFVNSINSNRNLSEEAIDRISTAEIFLGVEAKELGLIDALGGKEEAIKSAEELANISSSEIMTYSKSKSFIEKLAGIFVRPSYFIGRGIGDSFISISDKEILMAN